MDLIERQAAIDAINTWDKFGADERGRIVRWHEGLVIYVRLRDVLTSIVNQPSAQPVRLKGQWTDNNACPFCGFQPWYERDIHTLSYCPNCGADMRKDGD